MVSSTPPEAAAMASQWWSSVRAASAQAACATDGGRPAISSPGSIGRPQKTHSVAAGLMAGRVPQRDG